VTTTTLPVFSAYNNSNLKVSDKDHIE